MKHLPTYDDYLIEARARKSSSDMVLLYRGDDRKVDEYDPKNTGLSSIYGVGVYLTPHKDYADGYGQGGYLTTLEFPADYLARCINGDAKIDRKLFDAIMKLFVQLRGDSAKRLVAAYEDMYAHPENKERYSDELSEGDLTFFDVWVGIGSSDYSWNLNVGPKYHAVCQKLGYVGVHTHIGSKIEQYVLWDFDLVNKSRVKIEKTK